MTKFEMEEAGSGKHHSLLRNSKLASLERYVTAKMLGRQILADRRILHGTSRCAVSLI